MKQFYVFYAEWVSFGRASPFTCTLSVLMPVCCCGYSWKWQEWCTAAQAHTHSASPAYCECFLRYIFCYLWHGLFFRGCWTRLCVSPVASFYFTMFVFSRLVSSGHFPNSANLSTQRSFSITKNTMHMLYIFNDCTHRKWLAGQLSSFVMLNRIEENTFKAHKELICTERTKYHILFFN